MVHEHHMPVNSNGNVMLEIDSGEIDEVPESRVLIIMTGSCIYFHSSVIRVVRGPTPRNEANGDTGGTICMVKSPDGYIPVSLRVSTFGVLPEILMV